MRSLVKAPFAFFQEPSWNRREKFVLDSKRLENAVFDLQATASKKSSLTILSTPIHLEIQKGLSVSTYEGVLRIL